MLFIVCFYFLLVFQFTIDFLSNLILVAKDPIEMGSKRLTVCEFFPHSNYIPCHRSLLIL